MRIESVTSLLAAAVALACSSTSSNPVDGGADSGGALGDAGAETYVADVGPDDSAVPAIDPNAPMTTLTSAQIGELCDWEVMVLGVTYGEVIPCGPVTDTFPATRAACVANYTFSSAGCTVTVGQFEACIMQEAPSHGCNQGFAQCQPLTLCHPVHDQ
jgi:hypothetical protein